MPDSKEPRQDAALAVAQPSSQHDNPVPSVIMTGREYDTAYRYLAARYHVLSPVASFSGLAPQHGLVVMKVLVNPDPDAGEVYQDKLFCKHGSQNPDDDEVAITKVGLRRIAMTAGMDLHATVLKTEPNYWLVQATVSFVGMDGRKQSLSATEEYDLREGSPQIRGFRSTAQKEAARSHGLRGAEARALNAAVRELGIRQKYTRGELKKAFVVMRMMFMPDPTNELQMRIVTEQALGATSSMYPQAPPQALPILDPIQGMGQPAEAINVSHVVHPPTPPATPPAGDPPAGDPPPSALPDGFVLIRKLTVKQINRKPPKTGSFSKWVVLDSNGEEHTTIDKEFGVTIEHCYNKDNWQAGVPVKIESTANRFNENEIDGLYAQTAQDAEFDRDGDGK